MEQFIRGKPVLWISLVTLCFIAILSIIACGGDSAPKAVGSLSDGKINVDPGKYELVLPFEIENISLDSHVLTVRLEPGQSGTVNVLIKRTQQGQIQFELAPRIEIR